MIPFARGALICVALACASLARSTEPPKSKGTPPVSKESMPDLQFLEYLGTLEHDDENWTDVVNLELPRTEKAKTAPKAKPKSEPANDVSGRK